MTQENQPIACTLGDDELRDRRAWIAELTRDALRRHQRDDLVLYLYYLPDAAIRVHEMVRLERACCAFLTFEIAERPDHVLLTIAAPEAAREAASAMFGQFISPTSVVAASDGPTGQ